MVTESFSKRSAFFRNRNDSTAPFFVRRVVSLSFNLLNNEEKSRFLKVIGPSGSHYINNL